LRRAHHRVLACTGQGRLFLSERGLLRDICEVFDARGVDRIIGKVLFAALIEMEDAGWSEFCGAKGDCVPHKLRASELRAMLRLLDVWPSGPRNPAVSSAKGSGPVRHLRGA
jgi:hypothetical protein